MLELMPHQKRIIEANPDNAILNWEMRTGKTLPASIWIDHPKRGNNTYIICLKKNKKSWVAMNTKATVLTKEEFKKTTIINPTAIVIDEAHYFSSPLFIKGRSQLAEKMYRLLQNYPECHVLALSATPVRQDPWSLHTLLCYIGKYHDWKKWRDYFFELKKMPYLRFPAYFPRKDWRVKIRPFIEKYTDIVALADVVEDLPPAETYVVDVPSTPYKEPEDEVVTWTHEHQHEQEKKGEWIADLGYKKIIVVCYYTEQIDTIKKQLEEIKPVFVLDGRTKDQEAIIKQAQEAEECYFIVQSSCGEGWDGWMFGAMVFASMAHSCFQHTQMVGRQRHPKHLKVTETYYLIGGRWDKRIYNCITLSKDFNAHLYLQNEKDFDKI
jgi:superfamily II DNA or RNA helicase